MKFVVDRDALFSALSHASRIVLRTDAVPILSTVLIRAGEGQLSVRATNLDILAETSCAADVEAAGDVAVPLAPLAELLKRLPAGTLVHAEQAQPTSELSLKYRKSSASLPTLEPSNSVDLPIGGEAVSLEMPGAVFARLLSTPAHIASADAAYTFACGVHLHYVEAEDSLVGVATNGYRLTKLMVPAPDEAARAMPSITVPAKSVGELVKAAQDVGAGNVTLLISERLLSLVAPGVRITTKLVETIFPDYARGMPTDLSRSTTVASADLSAALQRARILADDKDRIIRCEVVDDVLSLSARGQRGGAIRETIEVEGGNSICFGVNAHLVSEALSAIDADVIEICSADRSAPIIMRRPGSTEVTCLIMPLRV
ncbi:DNA polymerase III subunit beta [Methylobacterium sp. WL19]|uniref:DNA polymerase III subunit beta n=1 Tax=Methylobacterium sp. WL19 TaxID=2603896 RepID=UPI0011CABC1C|nr:DNA polymerase III subunit beta [Methylobacterium sp. WL19]TXN26856.1 DNA polymerase III subunit beta [Methylobacterium sp. WL19]